MLTIKNLAKSYKGKEILKNTNIHLSNHGIHFLMGKNGSGKTTLIKCILGLERYEGTIQFQEKDIKQVRDDIFVIFDDVPLHNNLTGSQNVNLMLGRKANVQTDLLSEKKLREKVKHYSLGERKKLILIALQIKKPKYIIIDEISNGLDLETMDILKKYLRSAAKESFILATGHHFEFYQDMIDELLVLHEQEVRHIKNYQGEEGDLHGIYQQHVVSS